MQTFFQFVLDHYPLWISLIILLVLIIRMEIRTNIRGVHLLTPQQLISFMNQENATVIDIRDQSAYEKGHILGAKHISKEHLHETLSKWSEEEKKKPLIIHASQDQQGIHLGSSLRKKGFEYVGILKGGINAWVGASLPLSKN